MCAGVCDCRSRASGKRPEGARGSEVATWRGVASPLPPTPARGRPPPLRSMGVRKNESIRTEIGLLNCAVGPGVFIATSNSAGWNAYKMLPERPSP